MGRRRAAHGAVPPAAVWRGGAGRGGARRCAAGAVRGNRGQKAWVSPHGLRRARGEDSAGAGGAGRAGACPGAGLRRRRFIVRLWARAVGRKQAHGLLLTAEGGLRVLLVTAPIWGGGIKIITHRIRGGCCEGSFAVGPAARHCPWHLNPLGREGLRLALRQGTRRRCCLISGHPDQPRGERGPRRVSISCQSLEMSSPGQGRAGEFPSWELQAGDGATESKWQVPR